MLHQIKLKHSVKALVTIIKLKYFGHILRTSDSMEKIFVLGQLCKTKKARRNASNPDYIAARNHNHRLIINCHAKQRSGGTWFTKPWKIRSVRRSKGL